MVLSFTILIK